MKNIRYQKQLPDNKVRFVTEETNFITAFTLEVETTSDGEKKVTSFLPDFKIYATDSLYKAIEEAVSYEIS